MKDWQHGYDIDYLKQCEKRFEDYNKYSASPFSVVKKNNVAEGLHNKTLFIENNVAYERRVSKVRTPISMHGKSIFAQKFPGDITYDKTVGNIQEVFEDEQGENVWWFDWMDRGIYRPGFQYVGTKITTYGELIGVWYRGSNLKERTVPLDVIEYESIKKVSDMVDQDLISVIRSKLHSLPAFANHYSNYNQKNAWSAISLRGFSADPLFIAKPIEMSKSWKKANEHIDYTLQNTKFYNEFPEVEKLLSFVDGNIERVRFMRLTPGGGELQRHTDQVDPFSYNTNGGLVRLHFPIETNKNVEFVVWNPLNQKHIVNMGVGECWFLDTRKPHMVINKGAADRVHLVVDVEMTDKLRKELFDANR